MDRIETYAVVIFAILISSLSQDAMSTQGKPQTSVRTYPLASEADSQQVYAANDTRRYNITLWVKDWENKTGLGDLNVTIFDVKRKLSSSHISNGTGHVPIRFLDAGSYFISVQVGNRTVGYQKIGVAGNRTHVVRTWAYDLNMTLIDERGKPLANHTVTLYDQMVFRSPNFTILADAVRRKENYTLVTEQTGVSVRQAETNKNGTLRFIGVWNGTYRLGILGKETWTQEYVLGELVLVRQEPASGEYVIDHQKPLNITLKCVRVNLGLRFVSESGAAIRNATVDIRNLQGHLFFRDQTNRSGYVEHKNVYVINGSFAVSARYGNRTIGYASVTVAKSEVFTVKCWAYDLTVRCVDLDRRPLGNYVVFLYDQVVFYSPTNVTVTTNQTGHMVNWTKTDLNGTAYFKGFLNGTYWIRVMGGEIIGERMVDLQRATSITIVGNKTYMALTFVTQAGEPLAEATVLVFDEDGNLVLRDRTNENGLILREGMRPGNYTINVEWMRTQVWSGVLDISKNRHKTIACAVYRLTLRFVDAFGNILPRASVKFENRISAWQKYLVLEAETDEGGSISLLLPYGSYEVSSDYGIFSGSMVINLDDDYVMTVTCNLKSVLWMSLLGVSLPIIVFSLLLERRRLRLPMEIRRYKNMLSKLESMYKNGLVEYRVYRKLREEYEAKIIELGGREMR